MIVLIVWLLMAAMALFEVPRLLRTRSRRMLWAFGALWSFALILGTLQALQIPLPSPMAWIASASNWVWDLLVP